MANAGRSREIRFKHAAAAWGVAFIDRGTVPPQAA